MEEEKEEEMDLKRPADDFDVTFNIINLEEDDKIKADAKKLLAGKRKRDKIPLQVFRKKERKKVSESLFQKIFNDIMKKNTISRESIVAVAEDSRVKLDPEGVEFFYELSRAKASMKKFGLPSDICKNKFHVYAQLDFYESTGVVTDDKIVWNAYYATYMSNSEQKAMYKFSELYDFSIVSDTIFVCNDIKIGYCQDYYKHTAVINNSRINENEAGIIKKDIAEKKPGVLVLNNLAMPNDAKYNFYQYYSLIMVGKVGIDDMLKMATTLKFVNSKNDLSKGLKSIKVGNSGMYLNLLESKFTDFSPSCLFTEPVIPSVRMFVRGALDTNNVYNVMLGEKLTTTLDIPLPSNAVFWDNISSFIQLISLYKILDKTEKTFSDQVVKLVEIYYNNKEIINAWKRVYKEFETMVIRFYESISTKLTIDGVTKLEAKVFNFLTNYIYLKNDERNLTQVRILLGNIPRVSLMTNFVSTNIPYELGMAISKLIVTLKSGKALKDVKIDDMFRTLGLLSTKVLYGGTYQCIPKIRSKASFLGGAVGDMNNETFKKNVSYLVDEFKKGLEKKGKSEEKKMFGGGAKKMGQIIDALIRNSEKKLNDSFVNSNAERLNEKIKADKTLYESLIDDVENMFENGEEEADILSYGDFLDNDLFNSFIVAAGKLWNTASQVVKNPNVNEVIGALSVTPGATKGKNDVDFSDKTVVKTEDLPVAPVVELNLTKLGKAGQGYKEGVNDEAVKKRLDADLRTVVKQTRY